MAKKNKAGKKTLAFRAESGYLHHMRTSASIDIKEKKIYDPKVRKHVIAKLLTKK